MSGGAGREHLGMEALKKMMQALGYGFANPALLQQALTHPSYGLQNGIPDNQRLEFLGDAVLELCASRRLYDLFPNLPEGHLTRRRALLVCEASLCEAARRFDLGQALRLDPGEHKTGGREKPSVLADTMEAVIAAVYLDGGLEAAAALVDRVVADYDRGEMIESDAKTALQELLQGRGQVSPRYEITGEEGPPHAKVFTAQVFIGEELAGEGQGASKKQAQQRAAQQALAKR